MPGRQLKISEEPSNLPWTVTPSTSEKGKDGVMRLLQFQHSSAVRNKPKATTVLSTRRVTGVSLSRPSSRLRETFIISIQWTAPFNNFTLGLHMLTRERQRQGSFVIYERFSWKLPCSKRININLFRSKFVKRPKETSNVRFCNITTMEQRHTI